MEDSLDPAPVLDGRCGDELGVCLLGTPVLADDGSEVVGWRRVGLNGGADTACKCGRIQAVPHDAGFRATIEPPS